MSVDSKLFVSCNKEDVIDIGSIIIIALDRYVRTKLDNYWRYNTDCEGRLQFLHDKNLKKESSKFTNGVLGISGYSFDCLSITFGNGDSTHRTLHMFPTCSSDYSDVQDDYKVIFSIGYWGSSEEIMMVVAKAIKEFGDVYYDFNDCDDLDFIKL